MNARLALVLLSACLMACEAQETASPAAPMNEPAAAGEDSNSPATTPSEDPTVDP